MDFAVSERTEPILSMTDDTMLAFFSLYERAARIDDGPDEVHKVPLARRILRDRERNRTGVFETPTAELEDGSRGESLLRIDTGVTSQSVCLPAPRAGVRTNGRDHERLTCGRDVLAVVVG